MDSKDIILTNAYCCISEQAAKVSKLLSIGNRCAHKEAIKLKLLIDQVEALKCYMTESVNSEFLLKVLTSTYNSLFNAISNPTKTYRVIVNDIAYTMKGDGILTRGEIFEQIINSIDTIIIYNIYNKTSGKDEELTFISVIGDCTIESISLDTTLSDTMIKIPIIQPGICQRTNCLSEEEFNTIKNNVMNICGICECQLTT